MGTSSLPVAGLTLGLQRVGEEQPSEYSSLLYDDGYDLVFRANGNNGIKILLLVRHVEWLVITTASTLLFWVVTNGPNFVVETVREATYFVNPTDIVVHMLSFLRCI